MREKGLTSEFKARKTLSKYSLVIILLVFMTICSLVNENFLTPTNLINVMRQQSVVIILAFGEMVLFICGMLDLSCAAVLAFSGVLSVSAYKAVPNLLVAFGVAIGVAVICGFLIGIMVTWFKTPPFIATLAMQTVARGAALYYTGGQNIYEIGDYTVVGQNSVGIFPIPVLIMLALFIIISCIMRYTKFGRSAYAVGGNEEAANASGINVKEIKMKAFIINGVLVGIAAVIFMSRVNGGLPAGAQGYEFDAFTATIIGGTSTLGGVGTAAGTLLGAFIVGFLNNIMNLLSIDSYIQQIVRGIIIAVAVIWDIYSKGKQTHSSQN